MSDLVRMSAVAIVEGLKTGALTPLDCLDALERRIEEVDGSVNALPTRCFDRARRHALDLMAMPVPIKDLVGVEGVRSTQGSPIFAERIAETSNIVVSHLEDNGGIVYAMSNTPEFGAGANTFNEVFGITRNPWNTKRSAAGSSGGAAVALATGMAWVAHGTDTGGSLRNPASFCGICGMRPSPGRVAATPQSQIDSTLGVQGPMARNVEDLALLFDAMVGESGGDPMSLPSDGTSYFSAAQSGWKPRRVAVSRDLGLPPVHREVAAIIMAAAQRLAAEGIIVEEAHPDLREARSCNEVLRAMSFAGLQPLLEKHRAMMKPEVVWNIERGLALSGAEIAFAEAKRVDMFNKMNRFFETYDLLLCPATIVPPYPVEQRYVAECEGVQFENYVEWLTIVSAITLCCCPAISIPCGFTTEKLPVGLQIIAPCRREARLLAGARMIETILDLGAIVPIDPREN
jgi:amidase